MIKKQVTILITLWIILLGCTKTNHKEDTVATVEQEKAVYVDSLAYFEKVKKLSNGDTTGRWFDTTQPLPLMGAILPQKRIIAYYGNLYSKRMGILGELPPNELWERLDTELENWTLADPTTPTIPALHYIAVTAQGSAGRDGKYRLRMPHHQIDSVLTIANMRPECLVFLDIQVGHSSLKEELPHLTTYLRQPHIHLGIDPEFSMKDGSLPGRKIGTFSADDINYCTATLAQIVRDYQLPPKVLVVHRFTKNMLTNYNDIILRPEVQIVIDMDGWGAGTLKFSTYKQFIYREPVQFTGFKIFYGNDLKQAPHRLLTPKELLTLTPQPVYIQYQ